ncbi:MAG TPA: asparaginase [Micromonosporaceae bacterium]|nr:asparaginase [Micromonosporaceae bacterium]
MAGAYQGGPVLAEVVRSGFVESRHRGSLVVLGPDGAPVARVGDVDAPVFPRSANKPLQAVGMLRAGLRLADPADLAVVCASHSGEPEHLDRVAAMLDRAGLREDQLRCPPDLPIGERARLDWLRSGATRRRTAMNCSGKHTGMLLTCLAAGWSGEGYWAPEHPLQRHLRAAVEEQCGQRAAAVGVDGCGAALFAMSLTALAGAFLRLVTAGQSTLERTVADAMRAYPHLVGGVGPEREDSRLMAGVPGLLAKGGAEGVLAVALPGAGAVALKVDDGAKRPVGAVAVAALRRLGVQAPVLDELASPRVLGGGEPVGEVRAVV